jgi:spore germination protein YaaH/peptidoglycan/xylan/chitin deacetylase (PgdA/CDA1 family)
MLLCSSTPERPTGVCRGCGGVLLIAAVLALIPTVPLVAQGVPAIEFHFNYRPSTYGALESNIDRISLVVPEWFSVDGHGRLSGSVEQAVLDLSRRHNVPVMVQVKNLDGERGAFRADWAHDLLTTAAARERAIQSFLELCRVHDLYGIQIELEGVHLRNRDALSLFVREAAEMLHRHGFALSVSAVHRESDVPAEDSYSQWMWEHWRGAYDLHALGEAADFVRAVVYAQHTRRTPPGPSQSLPWLERVVKHFTDAIPAEKLVLGVGMGATHWYTVADPELYQIGARSWSRSLTRAELRELLERHSAAPLVWDHRQLAAFGFIERTGVFEWFVTDNDVRAFEAKLRLAQRFGLAGISMWINGDEDPGMWTRFHPHPVGRFPLSSPKESGRVDATEPMLPPFGGVPVLAWHYFVDSEEAVEGTLTETYSRFAQLIGFLAEQGFESVFPENARAPGVGGSRQVILTFDDGRAEHIRAAEILKQHGFRGIFFVIPERIGAGGYLTGDDLAHLAAAGHRVAVHGFHHRSLPKSGGEVAAALTLAHDRLREDAGVAPSTVEFAFPFGHYDPEIGAALSTRYRYLMTVNPGYWQPGATMVPRMLIVNGRSLDFFEAYLMGGDLYNPPLRLLSSDGTAVDSVRFLITGGNTPANPHVLSVSPDTAGQHYTIHDASSWLTVSGDTLTLDLRGLRDSFFPPDREVLGYALVEPVGEGFRFLSSGILHWIVEPVPAAAPGLEARERQ